MPNIIEEMFAVVPQQIKTLEVDAEKKIFKLNGVDIGDKCDYFEFSCTGGDGFEIRMGISKRIICANYGFYNNALIGKPIVGCCYCDKEEGEQDAKTRNE